MRTLERAAAMNLGKLSGVGFGTSGVRGRVVDLTPDVCYAYTAAFLRTTAPQGDRVALAIDLRPSSPTIASACAAAIEDAGLRVVFCGAIPTPALAYYAQTRQLPAIMVTGSHIPFDRNGMKFYTAGGEITKAEEEAISRSEIALAGVDPSVTLPAADRSALEAYCDRYVDFFPTRCLAGLRVGVYEHSSVARDALREVLHGLGAEVVELGRSDDFVPIDTEAVASADVERAQAWAKQHCFDAIVSTDGDGDRPLVGDENGEWLRGDIAGILTARHLAAQHVVTTVSCNSAVELCGAFASVMRTRIGSPYVIAAVDTLLAGGAREVVGFEPNGGFLVGAELAKDGRILAPLPTRDAMLPILSLLAMAREQRCKVSELTRDLPARFTASDRLQDMPTPKSLELLAALAASDDAVAALFDGLCQGPARLDQTDGLRLMFANAEIVHLRASGNAPELRCYAEADSAKRAEVLVGAALQRVQAKLAAAT